MREDKKELPEIELERDYQYLIDYFSFSMMLSTLVQIERRSVNTQSQFINFYLSSAKIVEMYTSIATTFTIHYVLV